MNNFKAHFRLFAFVMLGWMMLFACKPKREITPVVEPELVPREVIARMHGMQANFSFLSTRFSGTASLNGDRYNISGSLRIRKDSAIYISVTPVFGIELARALITPDSLFLLNRLDATYFKGDVQQLSRFFDAGIDFHMLQAMLVGNDFTRDRERHFTAINDREMIRLHAEGMTRGPAHQRQTQALWLDQTSMRPQQAMAYDAQTSRSIQLRYPGYQNVEGELIPSLLQMVFSDPLNKMELDLNYSRMVINRPQQITFTVPAHYKSMEF